MGKTEAAHLWNGCGLLIYAFVSKVERRPICEWRSNHQDLTKSMDIFDSTIAVGGERIRSMGGSLVAASNSLNLGNSTLPFRLPFANRGVPSVSIFSSSEPAVERPLVLMSSTTRILIGASLIGGDGARLPGVEATIGAVTGGPRLKGLLIAVWP
jgi:hypothetical protein